LKQLFYKIVIAALLAGCCGEATPVRRVDPPKAAEQREFQGSNIVDCKKIPLTTPPRED
jgi:PBP1b-binding outer membrane lipoprotein LpoB